MLISHKRKWGGGSELSIPWILNERPWTPWMQAQASELQLWPWPCGLFSCVTLHFSKG